MLMYKISHYVLIAVICSTLLYYCHVASDPFTAINEVVLLELISTLFWKGVYLSQVVQHGDPGCLVLYFLLALFRDYALLELFPFST